MTRKRLPIFILISLSIVGLALAAGKKADNDAIRTKARYYWMEGAKQQAMGKHDVAYELYRHAEQIDPGYIEAVEAANFYGLYTSQEFDSVSMAKMRQYVDTYPEDIPEAQMYAYLANSAGHYDEAIRIYERLLKQKPSNTQYLISIANALVLQTKYSQALEKLLSYQTQEGMSPDLSERMLLLCLMTEDSVQARNIMDEGTRRHPTSAEYEMVKVNYFIHANNIDSAFNAALKAEALEPNNGTAKIMLATIYQQRGDSVMYDRKVNEALLAEDFSLEDKMSIIVDYVQPLVSEGKGLQSAEHLFNTLIAQYPREPKLMELTSSYYSMMQNWDRAIETIGYAIDMDPSNTKYWNQLLYLDNNNNQYAKVEQDYNRALQYIKEPNNDMQTSLGLSYSLSKQYDKALGVYTQLIHDVDSTLTVGTKVDNTVLKNSLDYDTLIRLSNLYTMAGDAYQSLQDTTSSFAAYDNALYFNPENSMALNNYAYFISLTEGGDLAKAAKMSAKAVSYEPDNASFYDTYAWINYRMGDYANARILQHKAIELTAEGDASAELYDHYGDILDKCGRHPEAIEYWKKALELEPDNKTIKAKLK